MDVVRKYLCVQAANGCIVEKDRACGRSPMAAAKAPISRVFVFSVRLCILVAKLPVFEIERTSAMEIWLIIESRCMIVDADRKLTHL